MVAKKRKSKRQTLQTKYRIVKRTQQHHKKLKKGAIVGSTKKKQVDSGIPNDWPFKEDLLKEIQVAKEKMEEKKRVMKEKHREEATKRRTMGTIMETEEKPYSNLNFVKGILQSEQDNAEEDSDDGAIEMESKNLGQGSRRAYLKELRKVVDRADVILQVLDARDPNGTRSSAVSDMVLSDHRKKLVYVLNKADLVPREVLISWLRYLRKFHATIPFKCNTQAQKDNLRSTSGKVSKHDELSLKSTHAIGADELLGLLKNYCRVGDTKTIITVGIVGFPNVGKSSLVNSLLRTRAVGVSSTPGFTKVAQEVILDKNIRMIDSPGIVFADGDSAATSLRNCVNVEEMDDVLTPVQAILDRCPAEYLMQIYAIPAFKDASSFLAYVAKANGKLKKGGIPNITAAGKIVLHDWNNGKIKYYCKPPKSVIDENEIHENKEAKIVSGFSEEFNLEQWEQADMRVLNSLQQSNPDEDEALFIPVEGDEEDEDSDMEVDDDDED